MKNLLGGLVGALLGGYFLWLTVTTTPYIWPESFSSIGFLFEGAFLISLYAFPNLLNNLILFMVSWIIVGIVVALFSSSSLNSIRTSLWTGVVVFLFIVGGRLLLEPSFWEDSQRNFFLLEWFLRCAITSLLALVSSIPTSILRTRITSSGEAIPPPKIETVCTCGAVYKSRPLICAECGKQLVYASPLSRDGAAQ